MKPFTSTAENRALLPSPVADRDQEIEVLPFKLRQRFRSLWGDIDTEFSQHRNGLSTHRSRMRPGGKDVKDPIRLVPDQPLGHLASGGVACANNQHSLLAHGSARRSLSVSGRPISQERPYPSVYLVANSSKGRQPFRLGTFDRGRILEAPVNTFGGARKNRTVVASVIAYRHHVIKGLALKFLDGLGPVIRDVDAEFLHNSDRFRAHITRFGAGTEYLELPAPFGSKQALAYLTPGRIAGAQD
jgi:hypothetical protein